MFEPVTDTIKHTSRDITKTITQTSNKNSKGISDLNEKVLEFLNDTVVIAPYLASSLVYLLKPENKSQFKLLKDPNSIRMKDFLINSGIPVTLYSNMLSFREG